MESSSWTGNTMPVDSHTTCTKTNTIYYARRNCGTTAHRRRRVHEHTHTLTALIACMWVSVSVADKTRNVMAPCRGESWDHWMQCVWYVKWYCCLFCVGDFFVLCSCCRVLWLAAAREYGSGGARQMMNKKLRLCCSWFLRTQRAFIVLPYVQFLFRNVSRFSLLHFGACFEFLFSESAPTLDDERSWNKVIRGTGYRFVLHSCRSCFRSLLRM